MLIGHDKVQNYLNTLLSLDRGAPYFSWRYSASENGSTLWGARNLLFLGPEGVGKYALARQYARARLCERTSALEDEACGCGSCNAYTHSLHPDFIMLDCRAIEGGVEAMRSLKDALSRTPLGGKRAVIFDNAEAMTHEAGNALLKTLEEPRSNTSFILIAHRDTLSQTIRSRFEVVRVGRVRDRALLSELQGLPKEDRELLVYAAAGRPGHLFRLQADPRALERLRTYGSHLTMFLRGSVYQRMRYFDTIEEEDRNKEMLLWPRMLMDWLAVSEGLSRFYPELYRRDMVQAEFPSALLLKALTALLTIEGLKNRYTLNVSLLEEQLTLI